MKQIIVAFLVIFSIPALAVDGKDVTYAGGTIPNLKPGTIGQIDPTGSESLAFQYSDGKALIPFNKIESYEVTQEVRHHLGVLPAIGVGLVRARKQRHFVRIAYRSDTSTTQVVVFEIPKEMPKTLQAVLDTRAPHACAMTPYSQCTTNARAAQKAP